MTNEDGTSQETVQISGHYIIHDIPFTKQKVKELVDNAAEDFSPLGLIVIDQTGKKYSCNLSEFMNEDYDQLIDKKTGYAEYMATRNAKK